MSSIPLSWSRFVLAVATVALGAACTAQDSELLSPQLRNGAGGAEPTTPGEEPPPPTPIIPDPGPPKSQYKWNPLCHIDRNPVCVPDDDGRSTPLGPACSSTTQGCRLARESNMLAPTCKPATQKGVDGVACNDGSDCARGFDCVEGTSGNVCRRYCCTGSCGSNYSQNGGDTFCDVQKLVDPMAKGPVCMPLKRCTLLKPGECAENETCATVGEGRTGCVAKGEAGVGKSCDEQHCAADLTCIGQPGSRKCYQLCKVGAGGCPANQMCKTSAVFSDPAFGVCAAP